MKLQEIQFDFHSKSVVFVIFGLATLVRCELVGTNGGWSNDLVPIVKKGNYSIQYNNVINDSVSYLFLYDYLPVNFIIIIILFIIIQVNFFVCNFTGLGS